MEKTSIKLSKLIGLYLLSIAFLLVIVTVFVLMIFGRMTGKGADYTEELVEAWLDRAEEDRVFDTDTFPENADYILEKDGDVIGSMVDDGDMKKMTEAVLILKTYGMERYLDGQDVYLSECLEGETIFIHYSLKVKGELLFSISVPMIYILVILLPSVYLIYRLRKMIYTISEEKWREEYKTKQEMARIAHDLKTPLTIIRGNADLLLENTDDEDDINAINTIISNTERIAQNILVILEK